MLHAELWQTLATLDRQNTSMRAKSQYRPESDSYAVTMLNHEYIVNLAERGICSLAPPTAPVPAGFLEQLCVVAYLIHAKNLPQSHKLVKAESFPGGVFFFRANHQLPTERIAELFGKNPGLLYEAARPLGGIKKDFGDAAVEVLLFPRVPVTFVVWAADEEFESRVSILFDQTAAEHLPLDALNAAVGLAVDTLAMPSVSNT